MDLRSLIAVLFSLSLGCVRTPPPPAAIPPAEVARNAYLAPPPASRTEPHADPVPSDPAPTPPLTSQPTEVARDEGARQRPDAGLKGHLEPAVIQSVVRGHYDAFRRCYEDGLRRDRELRGRVAARFVIEHDGTVGKVTDAGSDLPNQDVKECIFAAYRQLRFPEPEGGGIVTVVYPVMFSPGDDTDAGPHH